MNTGASVENTATGFVPIGSLECNVNHENNTSSMKCYHCDARTKTKRLSRGWHRDSAGNPYCSKCWGALYMLRAITIPIAGPIDCTWSELCELLKILQCAATRLCNWAVTELAKADVVRTAEMTKLPKPATIYLYPGARAMAPELDSGSVVAILHAVEARWRARRFYVTWLAKESLPNYRYPVPYPIRSQGWKCEKDGEITIVNVRLGGRRRKLRLRGGHQFRRQLSTVHQLLDGKAIRSEMSLYWRRSNGNDHRPKGKGRDSGGQKCASRLMCKMVMWLPRKEAVDGKKGTLLVRTDSDSLLIALDIKGQKLWIENCDQVRRWTAEHARRLNRWNDDQKAEQRPVAKYQSRRESAALKYRRRLDSLCHEVSTHLANFAARRRYATVQYDDSLQSYCVRFSWALLRERIKTKLDEHGIHFEWLGAATSTRTFRNNTNEAA